MTKNFLFWILAIVITLAAAKYQRATGPTHPKRVSVETDNGEIKFTLVRSHGEENNCPVEIEIPDDKISGTIKYRRFPTNDEWSMDTMVREGEILKAYLPQQPPAGKVEYIIDLYKNDKLLNSTNEYHALVRYTGAVPSWVLIPHIFFIFFAMMLSNLTGIMAIAKHKRTIFYGWLTLGFLTLGGMIFGPIVQLYAFGDLWTGVPFGWDLTDNKTLVAFIMWIAAMVLNRKQKKYGWIIAAAIVMIIIFSIPHSMLGSELDYASGQVIQN